MHIYRGPHAVAAHPRVVTVGNFDGVHLGHQAMVHTLVERARAMGLPAAVMTFEPHPRELFAPEQAPTRLTSLREKCEALAQLGVDEVIVCRFDRRLCSVPAEAFVSDILVGKLAAHHVLIGDDFRFGRQRAGDWALLQRMAGELGFGATAISSVAADGERVSSTLIRDSLQGGDLPRAAHLLGRPYSMSGTVVRGNQIGRKLGFPTANIRLQHNRPPLLGIYAVSVSGLEPSVSGTDNGLLRGAASLGYRPTIGNELKPTLEVHLLDFDADIYGRHLHVDFLHKLRDEAKFADWDALRAQIALDVDQTRAYFQAHPLFLTGREAR